MFNNTVICLANWILNCMIIYDPIVISILLAVAVAGPGGDGTRKLNIRNRL